MRLFLFLFVGMLLCSGEVTANAEERHPLAMCSYEMQVWNVNLKSSVQTNIIRHTYAELRAEESDQMTGCTVCSEDQERIEIPPLAPFFVCRKIAPRVRNALSSLVRNGEPLHTVIGYHVIKSRGPVDGNGNRTGFSNHSFGTAIDINPELNGLYDNCIEFDPRCRLLRGGERRIGIPGTLEKDDEIVRTFKTAGFQWGGEIAGKQKDFMHFSLTGY